MGTRKVCELCGMRFTGFPATTCLICGVFCCPWCAKLDGQGDVCANCATEYEPPHEVIEDEDRDWEDDFRHMGIYLPGDDYDGGRFRDD